MVGKLFKEYYELHDQYRKKYGENVAVLMQVGKFFELYAPPDGSSSGNINEVTSLINCNLTYKETERMAGFPLQSLEKNVKRLTDNDFTVVVVEQTASTPDPVDGLAPRKITKVVSKGTNMENDRLRNNIMSIYYKSHGKSLHTFGIAVVDAVISQKIVVHDIYSTAEDKGFAFDTAIRFVAQYDPVECIFVTEEGYNIEDVQRHLGLKCATVTRDVQIIRNERAKFDDEVFSEPINHALAGLRMFLSEHQLDGHRLSVEMFKSENYLDLCSTAIRQLDIPMLLSKGKHSINMTVTAMGNRLLTNRMLCPTKDVALLHDRYDAIDGVDEGRCTWWRKALKNVPDLSKSNRKLANGMLSWGQFKSLHETYVQIMDIVRDVALREQLQDMIKDCSNNVRLNVVLAVAVSTDDEDNEEEKSTDPKSVGNDSGNNTDNNLGNVFPTGLHPDLDELYAKASQSQTFVDEFVQMATSMLPKCKTSLKIKERTGCLTTHIRAEILKNKMKCKVLKLPRQSIVYTDALRDNLCLLHDCKEKILELTSKYFGTFQTEFYDRHRLLLEKVSDEVAQLDLLQCAFFMKKRFRLCRPTIVDGHGKLEIRDLRHLLVEMINQNMRYVPNNCFLGHRTETFGMLLYGVNSCGKTSYLKSIGLAIVMAQAGLFVPATEMSFAPFSRIMTRIAGSDNMERSQSSFIVEMEELLSIVKRADEDTIVLGDEMCRGTEIASANAIVHTTIDWLRKKEVIFVAATHLHSIAETVSKTIPGIKIHHMKVILDNDGNVAYDRKLCEGPGPERYGLEIARALNFPARFVDMAEKYRNAADRSEQQQQLQRPTASAQVDKYRPRRSHYNARKILVSCENCGYKPHTPTSLPLDTHHILFQCNADPDGYHGSQHKNALHNLLSVCKECHCKIHNGTLRVESIQEIKGTKRVFVQIEKVETANLELSGN